jgi:phosphoglycerate dehydrogenase-like enzyme
VFGGLPHYNMKEVVSRQTHPLRRSNREHRVDIVLIGKDAAEKRVLYHSAFIPYPSHFSHLREAKSPLFETPTYAATLERSMAKRFTVLIADFLDETSIESAVLGDIAEFIMARATEESQLGDYLPRADAILLFHDLSILSELSFARAPRCRGVVRAGVGFNNVDVESATRHGVVVCNVPDYGTEEVADHAIMFLLALARRLVISHLAIRGGTWDYRTAVGTPRLRGKTFGLIGCGRIGTATALRAKALGLDVVFFDPYLRQGMDKALGIRRVHRLDELLNQSHFVSLHCYLDASTRHLINSRTIAQMRRGAMLINTARGPLVEESALLDALDSGQLSAAGLDVIEREPLDYERLRSHPSILLTPHTAFYSVEGYHELRTKTAEEVRRILLDESPRNPVNSVPPRPQSQT